MWPMLDALLASRRVVACVGAGGVGKTTLSATLALRSALAGRRTLVLTIDPARRLANALGLSTMGNVETRIDLAALGAEGELWAMTLDLSSGWDALVRRHATSPAQVERILGNRLYRTLSTQLSGSLEYLAAEQLHLLESSGRWDLVVLDTPPTAHALDFLDAPNRLVDLFDSDASRLLVGGASGLGRLGLSVLQMGSGLVLKSLARFTGAELLEALADFFGAFQGMYDGFKERAAATRTLLTGPKAGFVLVTSAEARAVDEALFFARELRRAGVELGAAVINRLGVDPLASGGSADDLAIALGLAHERIPNPPPHLSARLAKTIGELSGKAAADRAEAERLRRSLPAGVPLYGVARVPRDVHDLPGLAGVCARLNPLLPSEPGVLDASLHLP
jgi:anion-transporting  ArsA/GET3 family ATPase